MKAAIYEQYGPPEVLRIGEVPEPLPADDQLLVRVHASSVTTADWRLRASAFPGIMWLPGRVIFGLFRPKNHVLGGEFAGEVVAAGGAVSRFRPGDRVFGFCEGGSNAELVAVPETSAITTTPANLSDAEAAAVPFGGLAALVFLRDFAKVRPGQRVLVVGASGGVGVHAVQLARHFGAEVTGVASAASLDLVRALGAAHAIDYKTEDFTASGPTYDVILDTIGTTSFDRARRALTETGVFVPLNFGFRELLQLPTTSAFGRQKLVIGVNKDTQADMEFLAARLGAGDIRPVIDRTYPLDEIVAAHRYVEGRHRRGSVVLSVADAAAAERGAQA